MQITTISKDGVFTPKKTKTTDTATTIPMHEHEREYVLLNSTTVPAAVTVTGTDKISQEKM